MTISDELKELGRLLRDATHELERRRARIVILDVVLAALLMDRLGVLAGFLALGALSFVLGIVTEAWADYAAWRRDREKP